MLGLKLNHVSKRGPWQTGSTSIHIGITYIPHTSTEVPGDALYVQMYWHAIECTSVYRKLREQCWHRWWSMGFSVLWLAISFAASQSEARFETLVVLPVDKSEFCTFLPEASFGLRVLSLPASVCLCVCLSVCVRQPRACPCHKSSRVQARTIKLGQMVQKNLVKVPIVFGADWPWPSRSNLTWKAKFTPFWACPRHNSPHIQARTIKFG